MTGENNYNILIINENPAVHADFKRLILHDEPKKPIQPAHPTKPTILTPKLTNANVASKTSKTAIPPVATSLPKCNISNVFTSEEAIDLVQKALTQGKQFAVVFIDINMSSSLQGIRTIKKLWQLDGKIQVVIYTDLPDKNWEKTAATLKFGENLLILKKPFNGIMVKQLIRSLTNKWGLSLKINNYMENLDKLIMERTDNLNNLLSTLQAALDSSADGIVVIDNNNNLVYANNIFKEMWEIKDPATIQGKDIIKFISTNVVQNEASCNIFNNITASKKAPIIGKLQLINGKIFEVYIAPYSLANKVLGNVWSFSDISEKVTLTEKLYHQATHDHLTKLPNRLLLNELIKQEIVISHRNKKLFALLFFDLDNFKDINDNYDHNTGDLVLKEVARRLRYAIRESDIVARLGGDEFVMLLGDINGVQDIINIINKVTDEITAPMLIAERELSIFASIGVSTYPKDGDSVDELLRNADLAMYHAKKEGRATFKFYEESLNTTVSRYMEIKNSLTNVLKNNELFLVYQPQIDNQLNKIIAVEALLRWQHPDYGVLTPGDFLAIAEDSGMITTIGKWVATEACHQLKRWQEADIDIPKISLNVAEKQISDDNFIDFLTNLLTEINLSPKCIELDLAENVVKSHKITDKIEKLLSLGITVSFDDFGTGNTTLNHLKDININALKIDRSFVQNIGVNENDEILITAIVAIARSLNMKVVAEGVENEKQVNFLNSLHCNQVQGYYYSKPLRADELLQFINEKNIH